MTFDQLFKSKIKIMITDVISNQPMGHIPRRHIIFAPISVILLISLQIVEVILDLISKQLTSVYDLLNNVPVALVLRLQHLLKYVLPLGLDGLRDFGLELVDAAVHEVLRGIEVTDEWILLDEQLQQIILLVRQLLVRLLLLLIDFRDELVLLLHSVVVQLLRK